MNLRSHIKKLDAEKKLIRIKKPISTKYEAANILAELDGTPVIFENINDHKIQVAGNLNSSRDLVAMALGTEKEKLLKLMSKSINNLKSPKTVKTAPCQEVVEKDINLKSLPIMTYLKEDGGPYIPSAIIVVKDKELGRNVCFHRMMVVGKDKLAVRVVENRGTYNALKKSKGKLEVAICIGNSTAVLLAAATSIKPNEDEFALANAIEKTDLVKCKTVDLEVPAESEIVLEGIMTNDLTDEGPFMDLTGTLDYVRKQPTIKINCITRRKDAIYQTLLPGLSEHKILMGMPREPTILNEVKKVAKCKNILLTSGGNSWLHAVVQIEKRKADDGKKAIEAAFKGHNSLKLVTVVDDDINIYDSADVEWALSTRFQAAKDTIIMLNQPSSSLDPSAEKKEGEKTKTSKLGLDATIPWDKNRQEFEKSGYKKIDLKKYI